MTMSPLPLLLSVAALAGPRVSELRCEHGPDPLGIGTVRPRLSWIVESPRRAERQTAYRILAASSETTLGRGEGDLWDSGRVASERSAGVEYAGRPLRSRQRVFWKVRVWDGDGQPLEWSPAASFELGLLEAADWSAEWIGVPPPDEPEPDETAVEPAPARWIWYPEGDPREEAPAGRRYFRFAFDLPDRPIAGASWLMAADNSLRGWINGQLAGVTGFKWDEWRLTRVPVTPLLKPGRTVLALEAHNLGGDAKAGAVLQVTFADGEVLRVATDHEWRTARSVPDGWTEPGFDDAGWTAAMDLGPIEERSWDLRAYKSPDSPPATLLRNDFTSDKPIRHARAYVSAKGVYELFLNGRRVGQDLFRPGWTDYRDRIQSQTYDVASLLKDGPNAMGVLLGDGWYSGHVAGRGRINWGRATRALVQLEVEYDDGSRERIVSDGSWKAETGGPIRMSDMLMGETYDARLEMPGWAEPGFDDTGWRMVEAEPLGDVPVVPQRGPSVRRVMELKPVSVRETPAGSGTFVFDMGQNMVGWARLRVEGPAGRTVRLRFAEMLNEDGSIYTLNLRGAKATDRYTLRGGGPEVYEPTFTFHGFRYVEVTGYPGTPRHDAITGVVVSSVHDPTGTFETSNEMVDQLQSNIVWGQRGNYLEVPTDCPQRDERLGWMGDAQVFARTACFNFDVSSFLEKWLQDVRDTQNPAGGFPNYAPDPSPETDEPADWDRAGAPAWGDAGVIVPWAVYRCYGDIRVLKESYAAIKRWIAFIREGNPNLLWVERSGSNYGDWLNIDANAPRPVLATAYFARSAHLTARTAEVLGETEDAQAYDALFREIREAFGRAYVKPDGRIEGDTQTIYLLALAFDLLPDDIRPLTIRHLVADIEKRDAHLSTGFLGVSLINPVLTEVGRIDLAYRLLLNDTFPSWGYSIRHGATTIWERWDGWTAHAGFQDPGMNSFNHYSLGSVGEWMYAVVTGIDLDPVVPGYKRFVLRPRPGGGLTRARGELRSPYGPIVSDWTIEDGEIRWVVEVPPNTAATVYVPTSDPAAVTEGGVAAGTVDGLRLLRAEIGGAVYEIGSGFYEFAAPR